MVEDDVASNKAIGSYGASFIKNTLKDSKNISILTHCNTLAGARILQYCRLSALFYRSRNLGQSKNSRTLAMPMRANELTESIQPIPKDLDSASMKAGDFLVYVGLNAENEIIHTLAFLGVLMIWSQGSSSQWVDVMKRKRAVHEEIMNLVHQKRSSEQADKDAREEDEKVNTVSEEKRKKGRGYKRKAESFKDEEFYISSVPTNQVGSNPFILWVSSGHWGDGMGTGCDGMGTGDFNNPFDLFESLFENMGGMGVMGGGGRGTRTRAVDGEDEVYNLVLNFKEAVFGVEKKIEITLESCGTCNGCGAKHGTKASKRSTVGARSSHPISKDSSGCFPKVMACQSCTEGRVNFPPPVILVMWWSES
ncbi:hypothetical protein IFM89_003288 [Coptis chinensis]|uniref:Uncharacterized protein n=1 Tax=Coptis chinensis TaxID=261450 RepID=A0A835LUV0_9MAGN|nr:hypothetical protein IFM89_003288 [Coptis chinensis]